MRPIHSYETSSLTQDLIKMPLTLLYKWEVSLSEMANLGPLPALLTQVSRITITDLVSNAAFANYGEAGID